jgi:DNA-binding NtrC family response regulator
MNNQVVLIIDDEENILSSLKRLLRKEPYKVVATTRPEDAFRVLDNLKVSLVITDQRMHGASGDDIIHRVHEKFPGVKCIKLTGYSTSNRPVPRNGAWKVVPKPWNDVEIKDAIREALRIRSKEKPLSTAINQEGR